MNNFNYKPSDWNYGIKSRVYKRTLKKDIARGVKFLSDIAYAKDGGSTRGSMRFIQEVAKHIDLGKTYRAALTFENGGKWYTLKLFTKDGYTIMLKGCSFDYFGEGSRGSFAALTFCGFKPKQIERILNHTGRTKYNFFRRVVA